MAGVVASPASSQTTVAKQAPKVKDSAELSSASFSPRAREELRKPNGIGEKQEVKVTAKKLGQDQYGRDTYSVTPPEGVSLCTANGVKYQSAQDGTVNVSISDGYKMTLYLYDDVNSQLLRDANGNPQTMVVVNTASSPEIQTTNISVSTESKKLETKEVVKSEVKLEKKEKTEETKKIEKDTESDNTIMVTKGDTKQDLYGRPYSEFSVKLADGINLCTADGRTYPKNSDSTTTARVFVGSKATYYLRDNQGNFIKNNDGTFKTVQVVNNKEDGGSSTSTPNPSTSTTTTSRQETSPRTTSPDHTTTVPTGTQSTTGAQTSTSPDSSVKLAEGLVELNKVTEQKNVTVQVPIYGPFGGYRGTQSVTQKRNVSTTQVTVNLENGEEVFLANENKSLRADEQGKIKFNTDVPVIFIAKKGGQPRVYKVDSNSKACTDITNERESDEAIKKYNTRELSLTEGTENKVGSLIYLQRNDNGEVSKIEIKNSNGYSSSLTKDKNGNWIDKDKKEVTNISLKANGELSFRTREENDEKNIRYVHTIDKDGKYKKEECKYSLLEASKGICGVEYTEFGTRTDPEMPDVTTRRGFVNDVNTQRQDAETAIAKAMEKGTPPVFFSSFHGNVNYNQGTGRNSQWVSTINDAAKKLGYDGPIVILMNHCHSGVTQQEQEIMKQLPNGSILIKSQDSRMAQYNPNVPHSADGSTLEQEQNASVISSVKYFGDEVIYWGNNPTVAVTGAKSDVKIFSENGYYPGSRNQDLPNLDSAQIQEVLNASKMNERLTSQSEFLLRCLTFAEQETNQ